MTVLGEQDEQPCPPGDGRCTFPTDVYFPTHAPARNYEFATKVLYGDRVKIPLVCETGYTKIESPLTIMKKTMMEACIRNYNEILIVGRPHARVHFPETKEVEVQGIIHSAFDYAPHDEKVLEGLCKLNPDLKVEQA